MVKTLVKRAITVASPYLPPKVDETLSMWKVLGYFPNIAKPRSFNEHVAHRKLRGHDPRFAKLADKWAVREYVKDLIGEDHLIRAYQHVTDPAEIDFDALPSSFVIKGRHDWGSTILVEDKVELDIDELNRHLEAVLQSDHGEPTREYWYAEIPRGIIIEERIRDTTYDVPLDFKFFVFHGTTRLIENAHSRFQGEPHRFYDRSWTPLDLRRPGDTLAPIIERPKQLDEMLRVAETLSQGFDFIRVDLYAPNDERVLFGELTFGPDAGRHAFIPRSFDFQLGEYWSMGPPLSEAAHG